MNQHRAHHVGYLQLDIMDSIKNGVVEPPDIATDTGRTKQEVWDSLDRLICHGLVVQTHPPTYGGKRGCHAGRYALTERGRREYDRAIKAGRVPGVPHMQEGRR